MVLVKLCHLPLKKKNTKKTHFLSDTKKKKKKRLHETFSMSFNTQNDTSFETENAFATVTVM